MVTAPQAKNIFRPMRPADDGKPTLGRSLSTLGVRPGHDLPVDADGSVAPETGGMSVTPDRVEDVPPALLPRSLGGEGRHPLFVLAVELIPATLRVRVDNPKHANVEPSVRCGFEVYELHVQGTRSNWEPYP